MSREEIVFPERKTKRKNREEVIPPVKKPHQVVSQSRSKEEKKPSEAALLSCVNYLPAYIGYITSEKDHYKELAAAADKKYRKDIKQKDALLTEKDALLTALLIEKEQVNKKLQSEVTRNKELSAEVERLRNESIKKIAEKATKDHTGFKNAVESYTELSAKYDLQKKKLRDLGEVVSDSDYEDEAISDDEGWFGHGTTNVRNISDLKDCFTELVIYSRALEVLLDILPKHQGERLESQSRGAVDDENIRPVV